MNSKSSNSIILSNEQVNYLMGGTAGINRLSCLYQLIQMVTRQIETSNEVGESTTELWEVNISEVALSKLWKCDRKTVSKMLDHMNKLGILSSIQTRREVFTHCSAFQHGLLTARSLSIRTMSPSTKEATMTSQVLLLPQPPSPTKKILPSRMAVLLLHNLPTVPFLP